MKSIFVIAVLATTLLAESTLAWWDNGHLLVGEVASQLLEPADRKSIEKVLSKWDDDFPNTSKISTAAIWPDLIKCSKTSASCSTPLLPSFSMMEKWHFVNLPLNVNGSKWGGQEPDLNLFKASFGGEATDVLEKTFTTLATTKSNWAANLVLRNLIHIVGDLHQPLHVVAAVSDANPAGDQGGNLYKFAPPCAFANLHALWDAGAGQYTNYWSNNTRAIQPALERNATALIKLLPILQDAIDVGQYKTGYFSEFAKAIVDAAVFRKMILESYNLSTSAVYPKLNLTYDAAGFVACPSAEYVAYVAETVQSRIALAGKRLAVVLTQVAKQLRTLGLAKEIPTSC